MILLVLGYNFIEYENERVACYIEIYIRAVECGAASKHNWLVVL